MSENTNPQGSVQTVDGAANAILSMWEATDKQADEAQVDSVDEPQEEAQEESFEASSDDEYIDESAEETVEQESEEPEVKTFRVKVGNEEVEVSEDELLKGYSRTADYTKKTQALAEAKKAVEADMAQVEEAKKLRDTYSQRLQYIEQLLQSQNNENENLQELKEVDPIGYALKIAERTENEKRLQAVQAERQAIAQKQEAERQQALQKHLAQAQEQLKDAIPEFKDPAKAEIVRKDIKAFAKSIGFSDEELAQVYDPRAVQALYKAAMYDKLMANKGAANKKVQQAPKVLKAGNSNPQNSDQEAKKKDMAKLRQSGNKRDAAKLFERFL